MMRVTVPVAIQVLQLHGAALAVAPRRFAGRWRISFFGGCRKRAGTNTFQSERMPGYGAVLDIEPTSPGLRSSGTIRLASASL